MKDVRILLALPVLVFREKYNKICTVIYKYSAKTRFRGKTYFPREWDKEFPSETRNALWCLWRSGVVIFASTARTDVGFINNILRINKQN